MPNIPLIDLIEVYAELRKLMDDSDIPMPQRLRLATLAGKMRYHVGEAARKADLVGGAA